MAYRLNIALFVGLMMLAGLMVASARAQETATEEEAVAEGGTEAEVIDPELKRIRDEAARLEAEMALRKAELERELATLREERERLELEHQVATQKQTNELMAVELEKQRLEAEGALRAAREAEQMAAAKAELEKLKQASELSTVKLAAELAEAKAKLEKDTVEKQLQDAALAAELGTVKAEAQRIAAQQELEQAKRSAELSEVQGQQQKMLAEQGIKQIELRNRVMEVETEWQISTMEREASEADVLTRDFKNKWKDEINEEITYREEPFADGVLYVSDRQIKLNGPIITGTADYVCERIDYFNNESRMRPIFIVIDNCPGGSVMQGYRIVKAVETSKAPVHVVVTSFAASMAAVITTLADYSYAYPNAIILHHQMSSGTYGNMTDIQQQVELLKEWERRLAEPVAKKMGITTEEFKKRMYEEMASGDWEEFADEAVKLKWVNSVVNEIREEGERKRPVGDPPQPWWWAYFAQDDNGKTYVKLPPLEPMDAYAIYNPNGFYRVEGR